MNPRITSPRWLPFVVGVAVAAITICLWQALVMDQRAQIKRTVEARSALVRNEIAVQIQSHIQAVDRMAKRWQLTGMRDQQQRKADATMIVGDYKGLDGIRWVDPANHIGWTVSLRDHESEQGMYLAFEERRKTALEAARNTGRLAISRPIELTTGGKGFLIIVPLYDGENLEGYIDGFFRIQVLLDAVLAEELTGYAVVVSEDNDEIYRRSESSDRQGSAWANTKGLAFPAMNWRVEIWPEKKMVAELQSAVPTVTLIVGLLISFILTGTAWLAQAARNRSKTVEATSLDLKREVIERTSAENSLSAALEKPPVDACANSKVRVLLVEDYLINQEVAVRQLKNLGYSADVVGDGFAALKALELVRYDIVLMDCQMPRLDGYAATIEIRRRERLERHTPIIAMTANAMRGDRERCMAAGMDDYLTKPIEVNDLKRVLEQWSPTCSPLAVKNAATNSGASVQKTPLPVDQKRLLDAVGDAGRVPPVFVEFYRSQMADELKRLRLAIRSESAEEVTQISHGCAGMNANCGMLAVVAPLRELERMGRAGNLADAELIVDQVDAGFEHIHLFLAAMQRTERQLRHSNR